VTANVGAPVEHAICDSTAVREAEGVLVTVAGVEIGIFRVQGRLVAYENRCLHQGGPVCTGAVLGRLVAVLGPGGTIAEERFSTDELHLVCPWHGWEYDLASGACAADRRIRLRAFDVREQDGQVYVTV
jgi:nitrite reductase/ring-hydroxylating ferredoxin subunit